MLPRIYTYEDDEGRVYYSFYRHPMKYTEPKRLVLQSRVGEPLLKFLLRMKELYRGFLK